MGGGWGSGLRLHGRCGPRSSGSERLDASAACSLCWQSKVYQDFDGATELLGSPGFRV